MAIQYDPPMIHLPAGLEMLLADDAHEGDCPTCHQTTLLRPVRLTKKLMPALQFWRAHPGQRSINAEIIKRHFGSVAYTVYSRLKYWGFMEATETGWRLTEAGQMFMDGMSTVPEALWIYNDQARIVPREMLGRYITIDQVEPGIAPTRQQMAAESVKLDASGQPKML